jgi:zinc protease
MAEAPEVGRLAPFSLPTVDRSHTNSGLELQLVAAGSVPKASIRLVLSLGTAYETPGQTWISRLVSDYLKEGAGVLNGTGLADAVARMGGHLNVHVDDDCMTISSSVLAEYASDFVRLIGQIVRQPAFPAAELDRLKSDLQRNLDLSKVQPGALAAATFRRALYAGHPYGRLLTTPEVIDSFTAETAREFFEARALPSSSRLYVAGTFDVTEVTRAAEAAFQGWDGAAPEAALPAAPSSKRVIHLVDRPGAEQSTLSLGLPVPDPTDEIYVPLAVTNSLLGGSFYSRITLNIREDKGYTYSPRSALGTHPGAAHWVESADVTTNVTGASLHEIFAEVNRLGEEPPAADELAGIQNYVAGAYVLRHATPGGILDQLAFLDLHGLDHEWAAAYVDRVVTLTADEVQQIASDHIRSGDMVIAIVGDAAAIREEIAPYGPIQDVTIDDLCK